jgi:MFS family permease
MNAPLPEPAPVPAPAPVTAWTPLREPIFRMLWLVWLTANTCMWMNDVAAAWAMTTLTTSPVLIALVQTASSMPVFLLGLPSGALADILDRRRLLMFTQVWIAINAAALSLVAVFDLLSAPLLLALVFTNGIGLALRWPVFAALVPELVARPLLPTALALNAVAMNLSRVVGPLVAGALIASAGTEFVFALNFGLSVCAAIAVSRWRRESKPSVLPGERFIGAMRLGWQYVRESQHMKDALVRISVFFLHSTALLALLPLVAKRLGPGDGASTYTILLSSMGLGAIVTATQLPRVRARFTRDQFTLAGTAVQGLCTAVIAFAPTIWIAAPAMFVAGIFWILVANSVTVAAQLSLPDWVRARGMSMYQMSIMGASALGAVIWGKIADWTSVPTSLLVAGVSTLAAAMLTRNRTLDAHGSEDYTPTHPWEEPAPAYAIEHEQGPVMCTIEYVIDPARAREFDAVMARARSARLRQGAVSWGLFEDVQQPGRFVEYFACDTWADYLRRFERFTAGDEQMRAERYAFHIGAEPPRVARFLARHPSAR